MGKFAIPGVLAIVATLCGCGARSAGVPPVGETVAYVRAIGGSDANDGSVSRPFATIGRCASSAKPGTICSIRAGFYRETVIPNDGVTVRPFGDGAVWLLATQRVKNWKRYRGSIYAARVSIDPRLPANQVFLLAATPQPLHQAQWPRPSGNDLHPNWATAEAGTTSTRVVDSALPNADLRGAIANMWSGTDPWTHVTGPITSSGAGAFTFGPEVDGCPSLCAMPGGFFYVTGGLALLTGPGEWAYDASATTLYLWAPGGADPNGLDVEVKQRSTVADLSGRSGVTIQGISTAGGGIVMDARSRNNVLDGITALYVSQILHVGGKYPNGYFTYGSYPRDSGIVLNGSNNVFENGTVAYSATNGVLMYGSGNSVENSLIHDVDSLGDYSAAILSLTNGNAIEHDTIYNTGRSALTNPNDVTLDIGYNDLFDAMLISADGGEIYFQGRTPGITYRIHDNWIHAELASPKIVPPSNACGCPWGGVYIDSGGSGAQIDHNLIWASYPGIYLHGGDPGKSSRHDRVDYNTLPDKHQPSMWVNSLYGFAGTELSYNRIATPIQLDASAAKIPQVDNGPNAPGAGTFAQPGCSFAGCNPHG